MVDVFEISGPPDADGVVRFNGRSAGWGVDAFRRALGDGEIDVDYRLVWDLVDRKVVAFDALPVVRGAVGPPACGAQVWSTARRAGAVSDLVAAMVRSVEASQRTWAGFGIDACVTIAPVSAVGRARGRRRAFGWRRDRVEGHPTVSLDLDPEASYESFGLSPDRWWRVHVPAEAAVAEIRRCVRVGSVPATVHLSPSLVHRFTRDASRLALVARCIEAARRHDLVVQADGADEGESVNALALLGCHEASGAGLGADVRACDIPMLRWVSPALRIPSDRPLRAVAG